MGDSLRLRRATMDDADIILEWVNDPLDRANSFDSRMISREEHLAWMPLMIQPGFSIYWKMMGCLLATSSSIEKAIGLI